MKALVGRTQKEHIILDVHDLPKNRSTDKAVKNARVLSFSVFPFSHSKLYIRNAAIAQDGPGAFYFLPLQAVQVKIDDLFE